MGYANLLCDIFILTIDSAISKLAFTGFITGTFNFFSNVIVISWNAILIHPKIKTSAPSISIAFLPARTNFFNVEFLFFANDNTEVLIALVEQYFLSNPNLETLFLNVNPFSFKGDNILNLLPNWLAKKIEFSPDPITGIETFSLHADNPGSEKQLIIATSNFSFSAFTIPLITFGIAMASSYSVSIDPGPLTGTDNFTILFLSIFLLIKFNLLEISALPFLVFPLAVANW